ncbi:1-phosphofructokinase family hexose kinase [Fictibacillus sp. KU28468]|uniref:1-phosphofructokinase family hexose kinase n=1 Tax=Fictibacillus sp. KU28468 TaxID=2991053 RepID=UPI00223D9AFC|nr:1-phosphofructokinase family hexose kinase [Fictibacillus sp. KU28468]UZJ80952.1 1-phosphofructokinase family hexose kinase [Fictibacillus sp. KU28468]
MTNQKFVTTVTLNAAIDITYKLSSLRTGHIHRVGTCHKEPGGKGINVAKVLKAFHIPVIATGFAGGFNGKSICNMLDLFAVKHDFEPAAGESRLCITILDEEAGSQTELLEKGPVISEEEYGGFRRRLQKLAKLSEFVVFSGSLPSGLPSYTYKDLVGIVQLLGVKAVVDTSGESLKEAIKAKPFMIKPNFQELIEMTNRTTWSEDDIYDWIIHCQNLGISYPFVSMGENGLFAVIHGERWKVVPPKLQAVNTVGCGDTLIAALIAKMIEGKKTAEVLRAAAAAAAANAMEERAGVISLEKWNELKKSVAILRNGKEYYS